MIRAPLALAALLILPLTLAACGGGGGMTAQTTTTVAPPGAALNVQPCLDQPLGPGKQSVANLVVPDTLKVDFNQPAGFPNGRRLTDSVIDLELAFLFLDLSKHAPDVLTKLPLGPQANDVPFRTEFPYLAPPNGTPAPGPAGSNFNFRTDPPSAYVQVDRMALPGIASTVISGPNKLSYNDDSPAVDGTRKYVNDITATLGGLANALQDDWAKLNLTVCARPVG